ncbi:hypothetical protein XCR1_1880047 [Xenorhabdus cabanillasii JM26]|uniref:Uncharacterized protein n=1 Tax=Xenorhabdus cabanillasii JM26 TaxID=1427517 RepID=W1J297_9GAMM|nr:hypothetical protein XCR1_1880047 [Xenorhabdus cabanillasii JM26]
MMKTYLIPAIILKLTYFFAISDCNIRMECILFAIKAVRIIPPPISV